MPAMSASLRQHDADDSTTSQPDHRPIYPRDPASWAARARSPPPLPFAVAIRPLVS
jgi:hypothetical protein